MSTYIETSQYSNQYDNITSGTYFVYNNLGGYVYKSYESIYGAPALFKDHIKPYVEANSGAHYYVHSPYKNYTSASGRIDFNSVSHSITANRTAYISLGIIAVGTKYSSFDIGMTYDKVNSSWVPCAMTHSDYGYTTPTPIPVGNSVPLYNFFKKNYPTARYCTMKIEVSRSGNTDTVTYTCTYENSAGTTVGTCTNKFNFTTGDFFEAGTLKMRFTRFISLVPTTRTNDNADNSYLNAGISNLKLNSSNWTASQIDYAWSVQGANILELNISTLSGSTSNADSIKIKHQYQLH